MTGIGHKIRLALLIGISFAAFGQEAGAVLKDFGPLNFAGFPSWYRDTNGLALQQCIVNTPSPTGAGSMCATTMIANPAQVPPFDPALPVTFPPTPPNNFNWPGEAFYFQAAADPAFAVAGSTTTLVEFGIESTFNVGDPVPGEQTVFARVRISLIGMPVSGTYTVRHPYGTEVLQIDTADVKSGKMTRDIGFAGIIFQGALQGNIGPYLRWTPDATYPGGIAPVGTNPDGTITVAGETFISDPNVPHTVTGSPFDYNKIRIEGPQGADLDGAGNNFVETDLFVVEGRVWTTPIPSPLVIDRSTYARTALVGQVDVFANTSPQSNNPLIPTSSLDVSGSGITTTTLTTTAPTTNGSFVGYLSSPAGLPDPGVLPATVTVTNTADSPQSQATKTVVDEVKITEATFIPSSGTLRIKAVSSDQLTAQVLSAGSYGAMTGGGLNVADVTVPPATVSVTSSGGGQSSLPVSVRENYQIAASSSGNGTVVPAGSANAAPGGSQFFSFTPAPGSRVVNVEIDGAHLGPLTNYSFTDISSNHTIAVTFAP